MWKLSRCSQHRVPLSYTWWEPGGNGLAPRACCTPGCVDRKVLNCYIFKTLFRSARLGRDECTRHEPGGHGMTNPGPRPHADDPRPCGRGLRCMARLFGSTHLPTRVRVPYVAPTKHKAVALHLSPRWSKTWSGNRPRQVVLSAQRGAGQLPRQTPEQRYAGTRT